MSLGRGLSSLIPPRQTNANAGIEARSTVFSGKITPVTEVPVDKIKSNPYQPRQHFDQLKLDDLVQSVKIYGVLQPLLVTAEGDSFQLIAGERRLKASILAGLKTVPVIIKQANDLEKLELALIENIQRSDLNPIEKAEGYERLLHEFGLTQEEAAKKVGISRPSFANLLRLLALPDEIKKALAEGRITEGHAKVLLSLDNPVKQLAMYREITEQNLSVRDLEQNARQSSGGKAKKTHRSIHDPQVAAWEEELREDLHTPVKIVTKGETGQIKIDFFSLAELADLIKKIK